MANNLLTATLVSTKTKTVTGLHLAVALLAFAGAINFVVFTTPTFDSTGFMTTNSPIAPSDTGGGLPTMSNPDNPYNPYNQPNNTQVAPLDFIDLSVGAVSACAVKKDHTVWCWGLNIRGELGTSVPPNADRIEFTSTPVEVVENNQPMQNVTNVVVGDEFVCALKIDSSVWCWGYNAGLRLGNPVAGEWTATPFPVWDFNNNQLQNVVYLGPTGQGHTCAIKKDRTVWCWGWNDYLGLGNNLPDRTSLARPVVANANNDIFSDAVTVSTNLFHTCASKIDGTVWCWGSNMYSQNGDGTSQDSVFPKKLVAGNNTDLLAYFVTHETFTSSYALDKIGTIWNWGNCSSNNDIFETWRERDGNNLDWPLCQRVPVPFVDSQHIGITSAVGLASGGSHTCALKKDGTVLCWGQNGYGQLGNGAAPTNDSVIASQFEGKPQTVLDNNHQTLDRVAAIRAGGGQYSCALRLDSTIWCWGSLFYPYHDPIVPYLNYPVPSSVATPVLFP